MASDAADDETQTVHLSLPLKYQQTLLHEIIGEDGLVILARGLGLPRIIANLLYAFDAAGNNLIVVVGATERDNEWIGEGLAELDALNPQNRLQGGLTVVNTDMMTVDRREQLYAAGGIFSVTSRILAIDMLSEIVATARITGLVVLHAEKVTATSQEAFIMRLYRERNKDGFVKAFSDAPEAFATGFSPLSHMLRNMFLKKPFLWPRFQVLVAESLEPKGRRGKQKDVVEVVVEMSPYMKEIQTAVLECIEICLRELRGANPTMVMDSWDVENALHVQFDVLVRRQLDPVWHRISWKSKQIVGDLTTLRQILNALLKYDSVTFNKMLDVILASSTPPPGTTRQTHSPWLFLDAANVIFASAKQRVFAGGLPDDAALQAASGAALPEGLKPVLEEQPKWEQLGQIMDEIAHDMFANPRPTAEGENTGVLIMCEEEATCRQLREYLVHRRAAADGRVEPLMRRKLAEYLRWKADFAVVRQKLFVDARPAPKPAPKEQLGRARPPPNKRRRMRGGAAVAAPRPAHQHVSVEDDNADQVLQLLEDVQDEVLVVGDDDVVEVGTAAAFAVLDADDTVTVLPYDDDMDDYVLEELMPQFIIMYEPNPAFVRRIEVYRASNPGRALKVFLLYYGASVEEQRYLSEVRREKDAFSRVIRERGNMAMTLTSEAEALETPEETYFRKINTRIAGGGRLGVSTAPPVIVFDIRETRSPLPSLLHARQLKIVPCTLIVGDYILSPTICVERKSVPDLISSFKDGRLYTQCEVMTVHYKIPVLLIEFDHNKSFSLDPVSSVSATANLNSHDLQAKLVLLVLAFPNLKIIWSSGPYQTAEIFQDLKTNQEEPDPETAARIGLDEADDGSSLYNQAAVVSGAAAALTQNVLRGMPGITATNYRNIVYDVENLQALCNMPQAAIAESIGHEAAGKVWRFINRDLKGAET
ncbi:uncharacterized protein V1510DRAFT_359391 [Dipodascopsis tothii]|uniref:uncharacterized protein n=1 Tax=Dipodascopsis tothii TaxID=44089 RepID=UPI0034CEDD81